MTKWIKRWNDWISTTAARPGVWRRRDGGYRVRGRATNPRTGIMQEVNVQLPDADADRASAWLQDELRKVRQAAQAPAQSRTRFADFAVSLMERKIAAGEIRSAKGREKWNSTLRLHLIEPFGPFFISELRRVDVENWKASVSERINAGRYSPNTANGWLSILGVILNTAHAELELDRNPMTGVKPFDVSTHATYTDEEPNALAPGDVPRFLRVMHGLYPHYYAMVALGFCTGLRPSSLRPLRRIGATSDLKWDTGALLVRRSHTRRNEVMERTKTGIEGKIHLPESMLAILRAHTARFTPAQAASEWLFPGRYGGLLSPSALDEPFGDVTWLACVPHKVSPRAMRRTFQDLARAAEIRDIVTRSVSGHATEAMQRKYSTVAPEEQRAGLAKVVALFREAG